MSEILNLINDTIFTSLVNTTWQITLLIPIIALIIWIFRVKSAATRYSLWLFVIFAMIALPLITPLIPQMDFTGSHSQRSAGDKPDDMMKLGMEGSAGELSEASDSAPPVGAAKAAVGKEMDVSMINPVSVAYFVWCAGALFIFCATICAYGKLRKLRISSPDIRDPAVLELLSRLKRKIGVKRSVALRVSSEVYTPVSLGIFSPTIILPDGVMDSGSHDDMEMILTHELAHIKRHDYLINVIQNMLKVVFFFHPLFHLMNRNLAKEREHICDDWVIDMTEQRGGYAECIVGLLEKAIYKPVNIPVTIAMAERKRDIPGRIDMIVDKKRRITTKLSRKTLIALLLIGCLALPIIGGIGLVRSAGARPASDGGRIVFVSNASIWVMDVDGRNKKQLTTSDETMDCRPAWSPDGKRIAFSRWTDDANSWDIYTMNANGSNVSRLTDGPAGDAWPTWSPDGEQIAFGRYGEINAIYVMNSDGSNLKILAEDSSRLCYLAWSPDGTKIVYSGMDAGVSAVFVIDSNGENRKLLYRPGGGEGGANWSPDGDRIVFTTFKDSWGAWKSNDIYVMDDDGRNLRRITDPGPTWYYSPVWSPDGAKIAFSAAKDNDSPQDVCVMNADGSNVQQLTNSPAWEWQPDWTAHSYAIEPSGKLKSTWGKIKDRSFSR